MPHRLGHVHVPCQKRQLAIHAVLEIARLPRRWLRLRSTVGWLGFRERHAKRVLVAVAVGCAAPARESHKENALSVSAQIFALVLVLVLMEMLV